MKEMRLEDERRFFHIYRHSSGCAEQPEGARFRAVVAQRNLRRLASAVAGRGSGDAAIQYVGIDRTKATITG